MIVHRICKAKYAGAAFSGAGGMESSGRWHRKGQPVVYAAQTLSLAALEYLVHLGRRDSKLQLVRVQASVPDDIAVETVDFARLPMNWSVSPPVDATMEVGTAWLQARQSLVLRTPSVLVPGEYNYLINPQHADFNRITISPAVPYSFDARLLAGF